ncbi:MAG: hypothetical protein ACFFCW_01835 [Candidatus Hodarchaeota archaeon]
MRQESKEEESWRESLGGLCKIDRAEAAPKEGKEMRRDEKLIMFCVFTVALLGVIMVFAEDIPLLQTFFLSGSGADFEPWAGKVYLTIDSTADTSGARFYTEQINTGFPQLEVVQGYFAWMSSGPSTIDGDSAFPGDSMVIRLKTGFLGPADGYSWNVQVDTKAVFDTIYYELANTDDTLFKPNTWFEFDIWDSTSDSAGTVGGTISASRSYLVDARLHAR